MQDPKHIAGIGGLVNVPDPSLSPEIIKLEQEIVKGAKISGIGDDIDAQREYKDEMARLQSNFMQMDNTQDTDDDEYESSRENDENTKKDADIFSNLKTDPQPSQTWGNDSYVPKDPYMQRATIEEQKQNTINSLFNDVEDQDLGIDIDKDRDEDEKANLLEQIDMLRDTLEDDGVNLQSVPIVTKNNSLVDIRNVHKMLRLKNDRNRYCSFAEEMILAGAYGAEYLFDGEKEWFGRKPDLIGWPETVKVKLRRMRYDTSTFVQEVMQSYSFSPSLRILTELIPSMLLYSRKRKKTQNDTLVPEMSGTKKNSYEYQDAIANLNSIGENHR
jgi:hypothetical protein